MVSKNLKPHIDAHTIRGKTHAKRCRAFSEQVHLVRELYESEHKRGSMSIEFA